MPAQVTEPDLNCAWAGFIAMAMRLRVQRKGSVRYQGAASGGCEQGAHVRGRGHVSRQPTADVAYSRHGRTSGGGAGLQGQGCRHARGKAHPAGRSLGRVGSRTPRGCRAMHEGRRLTDRLSTTIFWRTACRIVCLRGIRLYRYSSCDSSKTCRPRPKKMCGHAQCNRGPKSRNYSCTVQLYCVQLQLLEL